MSMWYVWVLFKSKFALAPRKWSGCLASSGVWFVADDAMLLAYTFIIGASKSVGDVLELVILHILLLSTRMSFPINHGSLP